MSKDLSSKKKHRWIVQLQRNDGQVGPYEFSANWDPNKEGTREAVEKSAAVQAWWESGKKVDYYAIASELVEPESLKAAA